MRSSKHFILRSLDTRYKYNKNHFNLNGWQCYLCCRRIPGIGHYYNSFPELIQKTLRSILESADTSNVMGSALKPLSYRLSSNRCAGWKSGLKPLSTHIYSPFSLELEHTPSYRIARSNSGTAQVYGDAIPYGRRFRWDEASCAMTKLCFHSSLWVRNDPELLIVERLGGVRTMVELRCCRRASELN
jgi:hypothetical protein